LIVLGPQFVRHLCGLGQHLFREVLLKAVGAQNALHFHIRVIAVAEVFNHHAGERFERVGPVVEVNNNFVFCGRLFETAFPFGDADVVNEAQIIGRDGRVVGGAAEQSDDFDVLAFEHGDNPAVAVSPSTLLRAGTPWSVGPAASTAPVRCGLLEELNGNSVFVERALQIVAGDINFFAAVIRRKKAEALFHDPHTAGDQLLSVFTTRRSPAVFTQTDHLALFLEVDQRLTQFIAFGLVQAQRLGEIRAGERLIFGLIQVGKNALFERWICHAGSLAAD